jgi:hypothetical protein
MVAFVRDYQAVSGGQLGDVGAPGKRLQRSDVDAAAKFRAAVGTAGQDPDLSRQREELASRMNTVNATRERGALAVAGLTNYRPGRWFSATEPAFTTLARALPFRAPLRRRLLIVVEQ